MDKESLAKELKEHVLSTLADTIEFGRGEWLVYDKDGEEGIVDVTHPGPGEEQFLVVTKSSTLPEAQKEKLLFRVIIEPVHK